ncbi:MAG TPA: VTT domain-containing protein [Vicinamibacterales bacterium]|nr:VTT domain-containing protein [Vicinamibacterales bacterium]
MTDSIAAIDGSARRYRNFAILTTTVALAGAAIFAFGWPDFRPAVGYFLYAIPAHLLISVLANEPALFAAAKVTPPVWVAIAGTSGCIVAAILDYALIGWFVNHRLIKTELDDSRGYHTAQRFFARAPFILILMSALLPVPFYPVKILAIARDYPLVRFVAAVVIGRFPRFYLLALGGQKVQAHGGALVSAGVALALIGGWGVWRTIRRNRQKTTRTTGTNGNDRERKP